MQLTYGVGEYRAGEAGYTGVSREAGAFGTRTAVMCIPGAGRTAVTDFTSAVNASVVGTLGDAGYPLHFGDYCGHGTSYWLNGAWTWGNSEASGGAGAIAAGVTWMATYAKTAKVLLFGGSMGAADILNYYKANPAKVLGIGLAIPVLDLNDLSSNDKGFISSTLDASMNTLTLPQATITCATSMAASGLAAAGIPGAGAPGANKVNVKTSLGWQVVTFTGLADVGGKATFTGCTGGAGTMSTGGGVSQGYGATLVNAYGVAWPTLLSGGTLTASSPIAWTETAGGLTVPVKVWASDNDPIASNTAACQAWAAAVAAAGGGNVTPQVVSMGAVGHNSLVLNATQIAAWFDSIGGRN